jgi:hypothetical protein
MVWDTLNDICPSGLVGRYRASLHKKYVSRFVACCTGDGEADRPVPLKVEVIQLNDADAKSPRLLLDSVPSVTTATVTKYGQ